MNIVTVFSTLNAVLAKIGRSIQPVVLLALRLYWGWSFFRTGLGKLRNLDRVGEFFASLHIPMPHANAAIAGSVECVGGALLLLGLFSRIAAAPLIFTLLVAYATAEREALGAIFTDPDKFTGAEPFLFLLATIVVFAFGPGPLSIDGLLSRRRSRAVEVDAMSVTAGYTN